MGDQQKKYLIIGASSLSSTELISYYNEDKVSFYGVSSKKNYNNNLYQKICSYAQIKSFQNLNFDRVILISSRIPSQGGNLKDFMNVNKKNQEILKTINWSSGIDNRITFFSSFSVFKKGLLEIEDTTEREPFDYYGESKAEMEDFVLAYCRQNNINGLICRLPVFLYKGGKSNFINKLVTATKLKKSHTMYNPDQYLSAVFNAESIYKLDRQKIHGTSLLNCASTPDISFLEIAQLAQSHGLKEALWGETSTPSMKIELKNLESVLLTAPSAKRLIEDFFSSEIGPKNN